MPIQVNFNNGNPVFSPGLGAATGTSSDDVPPLVDLSDVNKVGLNDNDVLVYNEASKTWVPIDADVINNNDGGVF